MTGRQHFPVMLNEVIGALNPQDGAIYVDGTFGGGGYSRALLEAAQCHVWGIDRDPDACTRADALAAEFDGRLTLLTGCFGDMAALLADENVDAVDGVTLDLGVSSFQIDQAERGFSFQDDGPLDMRMSQTGPSAADIVNTEPEAALADLIYRYGEERRSRRIAREIVRARADAPITRTAQLAQIVRQCYPAGASASGAKTIDPATRTFQALRIYVNDELGELTRGLQAAETLLRDGGGLAVVSFHSLEDRIVKTFLRERSGGNPQSSRHLPQSKSTSPNPSFVLTARRAARPTKEEVARNFRSRSARLRTAIRTSSPAWPENESNSDPLAIGGTA
jgi:16S rRNA (cytosine1402-N4)-methyltransferase